MQTIFFHSDQLSVASEYLTQIVLEAKCDLTICRLTETSGPVNGGKEVLLFCDKINKDDIQVRFYEEKGDNVSWEGFGDFQPSDVHKQYGICFRTPRYKNIEVNNLPS